MSSSRKRRLHRINKKKVSTRTLVRTASFSTNTVSTLELSHGAPANTRPMEATDGAPQRMRTEDGLLVGLEGGVAGTGLGSHLMDRTSICLPPDGILLPASCGPGKWGSMLEDVGHQGNFVPAAMLTQLSSQVGLESGRHAANGEPCHSSQLVQPVLSQYVPPRFRSRRRQPSPVPSRGQLDRHLADLRARQHHWGPHRRVRDT